MLVCAPAWPLLPFWICLFVCFNFGLREFGNLGAAIVIRLLARLVHDRSVPSQPRRGGVWVSPAGQAEGGRLALLPASRTLAGGRARLHSLPKGSPGPFSEDTHSFRPIWATFPDAHSHRSALWLQL